MYEIKLKKEKNKDISPVIDSRVIKRKEKKQKFLKRLDICLLCQEEKLAIILWKGQNKLLSNKVK